MNRSTPKELQQRPASSVKRVKLITNPSAKYKPDGTSGIINIVLKKNAGLGINGNLSANAGNNGRYIGNLRLNDNPGEYNIYASYGIRKDNRNRTTSDTRLQVDSTPALTYYRGDLRSYASPLSNMPALGLDVHLNPRDELGLSANYFVNTFTRTDNLNVGLRNASGTAREEYDRNRYDPEYEKEYEFTAHAQHDFSKDEHKLRLEVTASRSPEQEDNHFTSVYLLPAPATSFDNT